MAYINIKINWPDDQSYYQVRMEVSPAVAELESFEEMLSFAEIAVLQGDKRALKNGNILYKFTLDPDLGAAYLAAFTKYCAITDLS